MSLKVVWLCLILYVSETLHYEDIGLVFKREPEEGMRCGVCPTYFDKICAFDFGTNQTYIFDNQCVMDLYDCIHGTDYVQMKYENCLYFGNFAYVHGTKFEDADYMEDHYAIKNSKKNKDFV